MEISCMKLYLRIIAASLLISTVFSMTSCGWLFGNKKGGGETNNDTSVGGGTNEKEEEKNVPKSFTVTFNSNGGTAIESQTVSEGECAARPEFPTREGYTFVGWYTDSSFSEIFDFSKEISSSCTVVARWLDTGNSTDTDGDGITDNVEELYGTDKTLADTDGDGLDDYLELSIGLNPLISDTDGDRVSDLDEDTDGDGLTNGEELILSTSLVTSDTDGDGLNDGAEVNTYNTNPLLSDTDSDGADDGFEIANDFDPTVYNDSFRVTVESEPLAQSGWVKASVEIDAAGEIASLVKIEPMLPGENDLLTEEVPGFLGTAYSFTAGGEFDTTVITFEYSSELGTLSDDFQPRIYYFNETLGVLEELDNQTVSEGCVSVEVTHFSTYMLLNKYEYDSFWENNGLPEVPSGTNTRADKNDDGIPDYYSMLFREGRITSSTGVKLFAGIDFDSNADYDGDGLKNGEEIQIVETLLPRGKTYVCKIISNPLSADSDKDGFEDCNDKNSSSWDVSYRDLALLAGIVYDDLSVGDVLSSCNIDFTTKDNGLIGSSSELVGWVVLNTIDSVTGLQAQVYCKENNLVFAFRGTEFLSEGIRDAVLSDALGFAMGLNLQATRLESFVKDTLKKYGRYFENIYVTGHSLGGYLALMGASAVAESSYAENLRAVVTFNGLGIGIETVNAPDLVALLGITHKILHYRTVTDVVSLLGGTPGVVRTIPVANSFGAHAKINFIEHFANNHRKPNYSVTLYGLNDEGVSWQDGYIVDDGSTFVGGYSGGLEFTPNGDGTCYVSSVGKCTDSFLIIPSVSPEGYVVTGIGEHAFHGCEFLVSVVVPDTVEIIDTSAFRECISLKSVEIRSGVKEIHGWTFAECSALNKVIIGSDVEIIGNDAFSGCLMLWDIYIPASVKIIDENAFAGCISLYEVEFERYSSLETIGDHAFAGCENLSYFNVPDSVESIGTSAFRECTTLTKVILGDGLVSMGGWAFAECLSLREVWIGNSLGAISNDAFADCESLRKIIIPSNVTLIDECAFMRCYSLQSVTFGTSSQLAVIGDHAFDGCTALKSVELPDSLEEIGTSAFRGCTSLESVLFGVGIRVINGWAFAECESLFKVCYRGSGAMWLDVSITSHGNEILTDSEICLGVV